MTQKSRLIVKRGPLSDVQLDTEKPWRGCRRGLNLAAVNTTTVQATNCHSEGVICCRSLHCSEVTKPVGGPYRDAMGVRVHSCEFKVQQMWHLLGKTNPSSRREKIDLEILKDLHNFGPLNKKRAFWNTVSLSRSVFLYICTSVCMDVLLASTKTAEQTSLTFVIQDFIR
jgi:hypothetical protein